MATDFFENSNFTPFWETAGREGGKSAAETASTYLGPQLTRHGNDISGDEFNRGLSGSQDFQNYMNYMRETGRDPSSGLGEAFQGAGLPAQLPHDYRFNPESGQLDRLSFLQRNPWASGALAAGGVLGGGLLMGALMPSAGAVLPSTSAGFTGTGFAPTVTSALAPSVLPSTAATFTGAGFAPSVTSGLGSLGSGSGLTPLASRPNAPMSAFRDPIRSALQGPSTMDRVRNLTEGMRRFAPNRDESSPQNQSVQQPIYPQQQNQRPQVNIPFSLQTPVYNQGLQGFGGFNR